MAARIRQAAGTLVFTIIAVALLRSSTALAFMLTMEGQGEPPRVATASALYASTPDGRIKNVLGVGTRVAREGVIADLGDPVIASDGSLIFGALVQFDKRVEWRILRADSTKDSRGRVEELFDDARVAEDCRPMITSEPRVAIGGDDSIVFVAGDDRGRSTLFRFARGEITCALRAGERTAQGQLIRALGFGTAQVSDDGAVALVATLAASSREASGSDTRKAILLVGPGHIVKVVAKEGDRTSDGRKYGADFGAPSIANAGANLLLAFTNHGPAGTSLFVGRPGRPTCALATGAATSAGPLTYLSNARPSLAADGSVAFEGASGERSMIVGVRAGEPFVIASEGDRIGGLNSITGLAASTLMADGRMYAEATDQTQHNGAYSFPASGVNTRPPSNAKLLSSDVDVFPSSLALDRSGRFAFLSRSPDQSETVKTAGEEDGVLF